MKKPQNRTIQGKKYLIYIMGPKQQIRTGKVIAKMIGSPLGALADVEDEYDENGKKKSLLDNSKLIGSVIKELLEKLDEEVVIDQMEILLPFIELEDEPGKFRKLNMEDDFHGELPLLFEVMAAALEVNFGNFLGMSKGLVEKLQGKFANVRKK